MRKTLLFSVLFSFLFTLSSVAQSDKTVHLKNGSIIYGQIIEQYPDSIVKIISNKNLWVFKMEDVEKIAGKPEFINTPDKNGLRLFVNVNYPIDGIDVSSTIGYRFKEKYTVGLGTGIGGYIDEGVFIPIYTSFQMDLKNKRRTPFIYANAGYSFRPDNYQRWNAIDYKSHAGIFQTGVGFKFRKSNNFGINLKVGYRVQAIFEEYSYYRNWENEDNLTKVENNSYLHRLDYGISFTF